MKILLAIPGHLKTVPMGRFTAEALRELGHDVTIFDYHATPWEKLCGHFGRAQEEKAATNKRLRREVGRVRPDLFITLFGFDISIESLAWLRQRKVPTACWWINDPFQFTRSIRKAPHYDFLFSNSSGSAQEYRAAGVANAHFLPTACVPAVHRTQASEEAYRCEVCFAGDWSPLREQLMEQLIGKFDVRIFGPWAKKIASDSALRSALSDGFFTPEQMVRMFASAQVVINIHTWFDKFDHGLNPRLFEAAGCGAYQIVDWKQEIPELFAVPSEIPCYRTLEEVPDLVRSALANATLTRDTGLAAQRRAYREHTYKNRMETMLDLMGRFGSDRSSKERHIAAS